MLLMRHIPTTRLFQKHICTSVIQAAASIILILNLIFQVVRKPNDLHKRYLTT